MNRFVRLPAFKLLSLSDSDSERAGEWSCGEVELERDVEVDKVDKVDRVDKVDKVGEATIGCGFPTGS